MTHPTQARINLDFLRHNLGVVRSLIQPTVKIMAVVKSNGYGHGVRHVAKEAVASGVDYLAVARVDEGIELRNAGIEIPILVFEIAAGPQIESALVRRLDLTITSLAGAEELDRVAAGTGMKARVHIKVDTGMGRLGLDPSGAAGVIKKIDNLSHLESAAVWSHFATADASDETYARHQLESFRHMLAELDDLGVQVPMRHMANSAAIVRFPEAHFDMVRPGIMMYGMMPAKELNDRLSLKPALSLLSRISFLKEVGPGTGISYGRTFVAGEKTRIATIPIGYADGYPRELSNKGEVLIRGRRFPVVGAVSMDHIMVDVGLQSDVAEDDPVTLIGDEGKESVSAWELAEWRNTIPYEIICGISARVPRVPVWDGGSGKGLAAHESVETRT